jgi:hypothetical protein
MMQAIVAAVLLAIPAAASAQIPIPGASPTRGPTASPATGDPTTQTSQGTANITQPDRQGAPAAGSTPVPPTTPSGAPPDVVVVPK